MVLWDEVSLSYIMSDDVTLADGPTYRHRGFSLDTVRNFISVEKIKEVKNSLAVAIAHIAIEGH